MILITAIIIVLVLVWAIVTCYWIPRWVLCVAKWGCPSVITQCAEGGREVVLTIDDVPSTSTAPLLHTIEAAGVRAILFVISGQVVGEAERELLVQAIQQGHVLGNHGHTDHMHARLALSDFVWELERCDALLNSLYAEAGVERQCKLFRPGSGFFTPHMLHILQERGYQLVLGSVYPHDPAIRSWWLNSWFIKLKLRVRDIIILHDREWTLRLLQFILPWAHTHGFVFTTTVT